MNLFVFRDPGGVNFFSGPQNDKMTNATNLREKSDAQFCLVAPEKCHSAGDNSRYTVSCGEVGGVFLLERVRLLSRSLTVRP